MKTKAIFLDRDGVINEIIYHHEMGILDSPFTVEQFKLLPNVGKAIQLLQHLHYKVIIISNQPGPAKGHFTLETHEKIRNKMINELQQTGVTVDGEYYCFHHPYGAVKSYTKTCTCRKPKPGMLKQAAKDHTIDLSHSWMIGDGIPDIQAGHAAGCTTILIGRMKCDLCKYMEDAHVTPDYIAPNLYKAALIIKAHTED
jgi:D-glycero-D-manno-heptose 1,7-bisphosphate phosphatase